VQVRQAIEELFDVRVLKVRTMNRKGKIKGRGPKSYQRPDWKRAIVTLAEGDSVEFL
jgi:large subunit ribosomal protein L23